VWKRNDQAETRGGGRQLIGLLAIKALAPIGLDADRLDSSRIDSLAAGLGFQI